MVEISHNDYQIRYDPATAVITCSGSFRLRGDEYASIVGLLNEAADAKPPTLTLDVRNLQFLNSSGINMLSKFILRVRKHGSSAVTVKGSNALPWQRRSLKNFQRLLPDLRLEWE